MKRKRILSWLVTLTVLSCSSPVVTMAEAFADEDLLIHSENSELSAGESTEKTEISEETLAGEEVQQDIPYQGEVSESESEDLLQSQPETETEIFTDPSVPAAGTAEADPADYSVHFENLREDDYWTYGYENSIYELTVNTDSLTGRNLKLRWSVGYRIEEQFGNDYFTTEIPEEYVFWKEKTEDNSRLVIDTAKLKQAIDWLYGTEGYSHWFEVRAQVVDAGGEGEPFFTAKAGLRGVCEAEEDYRYPSFASSILPGEKIQIGRSFDCYVKDEEHPDGALLPVQITGVRAGGASEGEEVSGADIFELTENSDGWQLLGKNPGYVKGILDYKDIHGNPQTYHFKIDIKNYVYRMELVSEDGSTRIAVNEKKKILINVYRKTDLDSPGEKLQPGQYYIAFKEESFEPGMFEIVDVNEEDSLISLRALENAGKRTKIKLIAGSKEATEDGMPIWETEGEIWLDIVSAVICDHNWVTESQTEPTCTEEGLRSERCTLCKETRETVIEKKPHTIVTVIDKKENCGNAGKRHQECSVCHGEKKALADIPATGKHNWKTTRQITSTCTKQGLKTEKCTVCGKPKDTVIKKKEHNMVKVVDQKADCVKPGKSHQECSVCHGQKKVLPDTPAKGHIWSKYTVKKAATVFKEGSKTRKCSKCKITDSVKIPKVKATVKLSHSKIKIFKGYTETITVSGLGAGDSIKSVSVLDEKRVKVERKNNTIKLTALTSGSSTVLTVKTAGGAKATCHVDFDKIRTSSIRGPRTMTVFRGKKKAINPKIIPSNSQEKVTYKIKSGKNRIRIHRSEGTVEGLKRGKAEIYIISGKAKRVCVITVT